MGIVGAIPCGCPQTRIGARPIPTISKPQLFSENSIDALFEKVKEIQDMELKSEWAKYLCVLVSGYLEVSIREIHVEYARRRADLRWNDRHTKNVIPVKTGIQKNSQNLLPE